MQLDEYEQLSEQWGGAEYLPRPATFINMRRVACLCHYKWVWVSRNEKLPYWCEQGQLHAPLAD
jgi:hypothetical protein